MPDVSVGSRLRSWAYALRTTNPPPDGPVDAVTRWLVVTRGAVLPMTLVSGLVAALLAGGKPGLDWRWLVLAVLGITLAHASNNLMNDLYDTQVGTDSATYPRALYAPHPVLSGLISRRTLGLAILLVNVADLAILVTLAWARGWPVVAFALGGFALAVAYPAPPLRLKKRGLGEPDVFLVWGPLMVGGTYYAAVGHLPWAVVLASLPYALLCTSVLMGKHIDKIPWDAPDAPAPLPVLLGERRARAVTKAMMVAFYPLVAVLVAVGTLPILSLLCLVGVVGLVKGGNPFAAPKPFAPPYGFPIGPLWFAALAFVHTRRAG